jgi:hypothetical protein
MATNCPNCGKPIRPGAKFCGNCGYTLPATPAQAGTPTPAPAAPGQAACPHCGKPVRPDAKFCPNCGKNIGAGVSPPTPIPGSLAPVQPSASPPAAPGISPVTPLPGSLPPVQPGSLPPAGPGISPVTPLPGSLQPMQPPIQQPAGGKPPPTAGKGSPPPTGAPAVRTGRRKWVLPAILAGVFLVIICAGGILFWQDPFGWRGGAEPTATIEQQAPAETQTATVTPSQTPLPSAPTASATLVFTSTPGAAPTLTQTIPAGQPAGTNTSTPATPLATQTASTTPLPAPNVIFSDDFTAWSDTNWNVWFGSPGMVVVNGRLELASSLPGEAGVFSKTKIPLRPGTVVKFNTGILSNPQSALPLVFDWVSITQTNGPIKSPGFMRLEITDKEAVIKIGTNVVTIPLENKSTHSFEIQIIKPRRAVFLIDDKKSELDLLVTPQDGYIAFSGSGWVDDLLVTGP